MCYILLIHASVDGHLGCFYLWLLWLVLLWTFMDKCLLEHLFSVLLVIHLRLELLVHIEILRLTYWGTATPCSRAAAPFYTPTSNAWGFQFLYILDPSINLWLAEWVLLQQWGEIPELLRLYLFNETILKQELETCEHFNAKYIKEFEIHEKQKVV